MSAPVKLMTPQEASRMILRERIREIYKASGNTYGSPRVFDALKDAGVRVSRKTVEAIMRESELVGSHAKKKIVPEIYYPPNLLLVLEKRGDKDVWCRNFDVREIDRVWTSDITQFATVDGWVYLALMIDLCSRRAVGWCMSAFPNTQLTLGALNMALRSRMPERGIIIHSDRGVQYTAKEYQSRIADAGARQSMSAKGTCLDNAPMESCFASFKRENNLIKLTRADAIATLERYIRHYNETRKHSALGNVSPAQFEALRRAARQR